MRFPSPKRLAEPIKPVASEKPSDYEAVEEEFPGVLGSSTGCLQVTQALRAT